MRNCSDSWSILEGHTHGYGIAGEDIPFSAERVTPCSKATPRRATGQVESIHWQQPWPWRCDNLGRREIDLNSRLTAKMTAKETMGVYECGEHLVKHCDRFVQSQHPKHGNRLHAAAYTNSRMLAGRLLHYFSPSEGNDTEDAWCGWHNDSRRSSVSQDNSVVTGLVPAMWLRGEPVEGGAASSSGGLHVRGRDRSILRVALPSDCLGFQIGEAAQILSGGTLVATPHQVRSHERKPGERPICRESFALFIEPQWDAAIAPPTGVGYDAVLKEEESELIPPLSKRLKRTPPDVTPVVFGEYLADSFEEYYKHNN
eukprot:Skav206361  [mRNA]  locus=scaffold3448:311571:317329:- [translate_table: standard]